VTDVSSEEDIAQREGRFFYPKNDFILTIFQKEMNREGVENEVLFVIWRRGKNMLYPDDMML
jgi:hypothetical protein